LKQEREWKKEREWERELKQVWEMEKELKQVWDGEKELEQKKERERERVSSIQGQQWGCWFVVGLYREEDSLPTYISSSMPRNLTALRPMAS
jgi:hypothetical protein